MRVLTPLPVAIPLFAAALLAALNRYLPRRVADALAILATVAAGAISAVLMVGSRHGLIVYWFGGWTPRAGVAVGISFAVDPLGAGLAVFTCTLTLAALIFSLRYFDSIGTLYHALMLGFLTGMCGFSLTGDIFNLFVFFELMSASAFALCGYKTEEHTAQQGALNFAVTNTIGAFLVLTGIGMLYSRSGALNMAQIGRALGGQDDILVIMSFVFIFCGFYVKAAAFPFHFWLADAHAVAPTPVCVLFSGVMVELGVYAVARVYWAIFSGPFNAHRHAITGVLLVMGSITSVIGAIMCFGQRHLKRLLAFSTISHVGLLMIAFALLSPDALTGAAAYVLGHGFVKGALFVVAGILLHGFGSVDQTELHGKATKMRWTAAIFVLGGLALAGMPPFGTFFGEHTIEEAAQHSGQAWVSIIFFLAGMFTSAAVLRVAGHVFFGWGPKQDRSTGGSQKISEKRETKGPDAMSPTMFASGAGLLVLGLVIMLVPHFEEGIRSAAFTMTDARGYQARVLDGGHFSSQMAPEEKSSMAGSLVRSFGTTAAAIALAAFTLSPKWPNRKKHPSFIPIRGPMYALRSIHTGHVGDYVAFLTFGVATVGAVLALLIRGIGM